MPSRKVWSLDHVNETHLPVEWKDGRRWLARKLAKGELKGVRFGRTWMMRDSDIEYMLAKFSNDEQVIDQASPETEVAQPQPVSLIADGLSARSRNTRLKTAQR